MVGVYVIKNKKNGAMYIGCSKDIEKRWEQHKKMLCKGKHHSYKLQHDYDKFGIEQFDLGLIELCELEDMYDVEAFYIEQLNTYNRGYNCSIPKVVPYALRKKAEGDEFLINIKEDENIFGFTRLFNSEVVEFEVASYYKFFMLICNGNLEKNTNRIMCKGEFANISSMAKLFKATERTVYSFLKYSKEKDIIAEDSGFFYLNPKYALSGVSIKWTTLKLFKEKTKRHENI